MRLQRCCCLLVLRLGLLVGKPSGVPGFENVEAGGRLVLVQPVADWRFILSRGQWISGKHYCSNPIEIRLGEERRGERGFSHCNAEPKREQMFDSP
ncbi:uncharacterized protein LY89DRAFT_679862 [Mollisia scopiformis]|uniref:Secreted protein n=1 Tax=Mollisia scopiformis TaxID=149040 RepID=A0A194XSM8_MOLSC|nr:uncharacterized protein LY89DRAFT_679862 [Mollisia scopiformis]KUJ23044.1 hypothetical protein LY89DRAFT_679862 [Mollisia scopiformis]